MKRPTDLILRSRATTKALTRSRKRRAVAERPSRPGSRSLWFVTAERAREGNSPEGDDMASTPRRSRDIPGIYAHCEHTSSQNYLRFQLYRTPQLMVWLRRKPRITCSDSSRRWARIPPMAPTTVIGPVAPRPRISLYCTGSFFERAGSVSNSHRSDAGVGPPAKAENHPRCPGRTGNATERRPRLALAFSERYPCGSMSLHPPGFIEPCLPTGSRTAPTGPQWAYEIKHDGSASSATATASACACSHAPATSGARSSLRSRPPCERCRSAR